MVTLSLPMAKARGFLASVLTYHEYFPVCVPLSAGEPGLSLRISLRPENFLRTTSSVLTFGSKEPSRFPFWFSLVRHRATLVRQDGSALPGLGRYSPGFKFNFNFYTPILVGLQ